MQMDTHESNISRGAVWGIPGQ